MDRSNRRTDTDRENGPNFRGILRWCPRYPRASQRERDTYSACWQADQRA